MSEAFSAPPSRAKSDHAKSEDSHVGLGLGGWITLLILGILIPMAVLAAIATREAVQSTRVLAQTRLSDLSRALATAVDHRLKAQLTALDVFAVSPALEGSPEAWNTLQLDTQARLVASRIGGAIALFGTSGEQIINTLMPRGAVLPPTALSTMVSDAVRTGMPQVSDLARSSVTGRLGFGVALPVQREGRVVAVLAVLSNTTILHDLLAQQGLPEGMFASLVDRKAVVIARSDHRHTDFAGRPIVQDNARKLAEAPSGHYAGFALEGIWRQFAFTKLSVATGWSLVVGQAADEFNAEAERYGTNLALLGMVAVGMGGALALFITRLIVQPIAELDRYANALGTSDSDQQRRITQARVHQVARLQANLLLAERRLRDNENRFRDLLTLLDRAIFMARRMDGTILYWSQGASDFYGWARDDALGANSHELLRTDFSEPLGVIEEMLSTTGHWRGTLTHTTKDGHHVEVIAQMSVAHAGASQGDVLEILHDVTEYHQSQRELQLALETGQIGTFFIALGTGQVTLDPRSRALLMTVQDVMTRETFLSLIPSEERAHFDMSLARCIGVRGDGILDVEIAFTQPGLEETIISMRGQAEYYNGTPVSIAGVMMDVTRLRQKAEIQISQSASVSKTG